VTSLWVRPHNRLSAGCRAAGAVRHLAGARSGCTPLCDADPPDRCAVGGARLQGRRGV